MSASASTLLSLPDDVLKMVLQHVPLNDRLQHACLVNRRLHAAAVAATKEVTVSRSQAASAMQWLARYGQHVTRLYVYNYQHSLRELPCPNLVHLYLHTTSSVQLGPAAPAGGAQGVLQACTALTSLTVHCSELEGFQGVALDGLSHLVGLQHLYLLPKALLSHGLSAATLPRLSHLTRLGVQGLSLDNLGQLSALSSLQELVLKAAGEVAVGPGSVPGLAFPAALTSLQLWSPVESAVFSLLPTGLIHLRVVCDVVGPAELFLSGVARLQQLTRLELNPYNSQDWPPAGPAYSALTASSKLNSLLLEGTAMLAAGLPEGVRVWPFVFPAAHSLLHLTHLSLCEDSGGIPTDPAQWGPTWGPADVPSLVRCCPNLHSIHTMHLMHGDHVSELRKLTALSGLRVLYGPAEPEEVEWSLKQLGFVIQLRNLVVTLDGEDVGVAALLPLTQLKRLVEFECTSMFDEEWGDGEADVDVAFSNTKAADAEPDVYIQLLEHCAVALSESDPYSEAAAEAVQSLAQVSAQQRQAAADSCSLVASEQHQLAALQQQVAALQQQLAAQQQQIALLLQAQPHPQSEPGQAAAGQGGPVASLQEQLQQQSLMQ